MGSALRDKTVLIIDSNPTSAPPPIPAPTTGPEFHPDAVYRVNVDTDGDAHAVRSVDAGGPGSLLLSAGRHRFAHSSASSS